MATRTTLAVLLILVVFPLPLLTGCGSANMPTVVNAQSVPTCRSEGFAIGTVRADNATILETPDALEFASPVCPDDGQFHRYSYTLLFDHQTQLAAIESGSYSGVLQEMAVWIEFQTPDGHDNYLTHQYDKHVDVVGNRHDVIPFRAFLPRGTIITIIASPVGCIQASSTFPCAFAHKLSLTGRM